MSGRTTWLFLVLAAALILVPGCTAFPLKAQQVWRSASRHDYPSGPIGSEEFEAGLDRYTGSRRHPVTSAKLLQNGEEAYPEMLRLIREAKHTIVFETYIIENDETTETFFQALKDAAGRGVRVRVLVDAAGFHRGFIARLDELTDHGVEARVFNPFLLSWTILRGNNRDHRKILVADGRHAILGGINLSDIQDGDGFTGWRDTALRISGPGALDAERVFMETWTQGGRGWVGKNLPIASLNPIKNALDRPLLPDDSAWPGERAADDVVDDERASVDDAIARGATSANSGNPKSPEDSASGSGGLTNERASVDDAIVWGATSASSDNPNRPGTSASSNGGLANKRVSADNGLVADVASGNLSIPSQPDAHANTVRLIDERSAADDVARNGVPSGNSFNPNSTVNPASGDGGFLADAEANADGSAGAGRAAGSAGAAAVDVGADTNAGGESGGGRADRTPAGGPGAMVRVVSSSPDQGNSPTYDLAILGILGARERLDIASAYFVPPYNLRRALLAAARRGVTVRLLVPGVTDVRLVREMGMRFYGELLEAGVRIYEWQTPILHAKTMVADGQWLVVGSANMDSRSYFLNYESCLALSDPVIAREAHEDFDRDVEAAVELTLEKWRRRSLGQKTLEKVLIPIAGQY